MHTPRQLANLLPWLVLRDSVVLVSRLLISLENSDEVSHDGQHVAQFVSAYRRRDPVGPWSLHERDAPDCPGARLGAGEQLGPPVVWIGAVLRKPAFHEQIGDTQYRLPRQAHAPPDRSNGARFVEDAAE